MFLKLMLESWFFFIKKLVLIRTIKLILLITKLHSKGLERNIRNMDVEIEHSLMFLIEFWHSKWKCFIFLHSFLVEYTWTWHSKFVQLIWIIHYNTYWLKVQISKWFRMTKYVISNDLKKSYLKILFWKV